MSDLVIPPLGEPASSSPAVVPPAPPPATEEASSQALSEALRASFWFVKVVMVGLVALFLGSGGFIVKPNEVGVVLRFGRPVGEGAARLYAPGWHWAWPYPIDEKVRIPLGQTHTVTSTAGWYATTPEAEARNEEPPEKGFLSPEADGYTLTADGNIIHARATVKYRITDPVRYTFGFSSAAETLTNIVNNALFYASARVKADEALYKDKTRFRDLVLERVARAIEELGLGITLEPSDVETKAPVDVSNAFKQVAAAEQDLDKTNSLARGYRDELTRKALGEANALLSAGLVASNHTVGAVDAEARAFRSQLPRYLENPDLFKRRMLVATMERLLTNKNVNAKFVMADRFDQLRLQLSREPEAPRRKDGKP